MTRRREPAADSVHKPIIFDFDGVIVDSEPLANRALAETLTAMGMPTTTEEAMRDYIGLRMSDCVLAVARIHGRKPPEDFVDACRARAANLLRENLQPVRGAPVFIRSCIAARTAIASSSSVRGINNSLELVGLAGHFDGRIFSAADIERGKPHPDIFLHAARGLNAAPADCIVIEDGTLGVKGAVAAGMTVIGLTAGSHCGPDHAHRLREAGAHVVANSYAEIAAMMRDI
jgi:HAD superfamily hydrolase (TIGR01509 family)